MSASVGRCRKGRRSFVLGLRVAGADDVRRLKAADGPLLHIWGSSDWLQTLIAADLIDEHRLWVFPVVLGTGKRLFENGVPPRGLSLVATRSTPTGIVLNTYQGCARAAATSRCSRA